MVLGLASLEQAAPHLCVHRIRQCRSFFILYFLDLHQVSHNLLSGLEGPLIAILLIRVTWTQWRYGNSGSATTAVGVGTGRGWGDPSLGKEGPDDDTTGGSP